MNNQDKVTMEHFYRIRRDPTLGKGFCAMQQILCDCTGCVEQLSNNLLPNRDTTPQPSYAIKPKPGSTLTSYVTIINGIFKN